MSRSRHFVFTKNNYTDKDETYFATLPCEYIVFGYEEAPTTNTIHLQGFVSFANARSVKAVRKQFNCHVEVCAGGPVKAIAYCKKDGIFFEAGEPPCESLSAGVRGIERWRNIRIAAESGDWSDIPDDVIVRYPRNLEFLRHRWLSQNCPADLDQLDNVWLHGPTGSGKSRSVRDFARSQSLRIYLKECTKWWDGYNGEPLVLIEEFGPEHVKPLGELLKIWADHYAFRCEPKGGTLLIRPRSVIVTSNWSISDLFTMSGQVEPLQRRFKEVMMAPEA